MSTSIFGQGRRAPVIPKGTIMGGGVISGYDKPPASGAGWGGSGSRPSGGGYSGWPFGGGGGMASWTPTGWGPNGPTGGPNDGPSTGSGLGWGGVPDFFKESVERDPYQSETYDTIKKYTEGLSKNQDASAVAAMGRQRDAISGMVNEFQGGAAGRGTYGTGIGGLGAARILSGGTRSLAETNSRLADSARGQTLQALGLQSGAANASAADLNTKSANNTARYAAIQGAANSAAASAAALQNQQFGNMMDMMRFYAG